MKADSLPLHQIPAIDAAPTLRALDSFAIAYVAIEPQRGRFTASAAATRILSAQELEDLRLYILSVAVGERDLDQGSRMPKALPEWRQWMLRFRWAAGAAGLMAVVVLQPSVRPANDACSASAQLTSRERQIARLITMGESAKRIAARLGISEHTVRHHTERIFAKLGVRSRAAVAAIAGRWPSHAPIIESYD
jgi:DNA-binding CsgD family transcriptional regulator